MLFVRDVINDHKSSDLYKGAWTSNEYANQRNIEAVRREKVYRDIAGRLKVNDFVPCHRMRTNIYNTVAVSFNSFLLGNGLSLSDKKQKEKLGRKFDTVLLKAGYAAITQTVSYIFWNKDHAELFTNLVFAPLMDETTSSLRAGVRWWQIANDKPLRATLYEEDGYTEYVWNLNKDGQVNIDGEVLHEKVSYKYNTDKAPIDSEYTITNQQNYPSFPIIPLWSNSQHINTFDGLKPTTDQIDELTNALNDDLTETQLYWMIQGADGMDKTDLAQFLRDMRELKIINPAEGQNVQPYTVTMPTADRQNEIARLKHQVYEDFQVIDINEIKGGAITATQIKAAYEPMNHKADDFEMCVLDCLYNLFQLIPGLEDEEPTFTRSLVINQSELIQSLVQAAQFINAPEYLTEKILSIIGDIDKTEEVIAEQKELEGQRFGVTDDAA